MYGDWFLGRLVVASRSRVGIALPAVFRERISPRIFRFLVRAIDSCGYFFLGKK